MIFTYSATTKKVFACVTGMAMVLSLITPVFLLGVPSAYANKGFDIVFTGTGGGSIAFSSVIGSPSPSTNPCTDTCSNSLNNDATGILTVTPDEGSVFVGWTGEWDTSGGGSTTCTGTTSPCNFDLGNKAQTLTATFNLEEGSDTGTISGTKYDSSTEDSIEGWTIHLYNSEDELVTSTTTDSEGDYSFAGLEDDAYTVCEELQNGWTQISPDDESEDGTDCLGLDEEHAPFGYSIQVEDASDHEGNDFWNTPPASISGSKINWDTEAGVSGWTIYLYDSEGSFITSTTTNSEGYYTFDGLLEDTYTVCEELQDEWIQVSPEDGPDCTELDGSYAQYGHEVVLEAGDNSEENDFENDPMNEGVISGYKFEDIDGDGAFDLGEEPLNDWEIYLLTADGETVIDSAYTGSGDWDDGYYEFSELPAGTYLVCEVKEGDWLQSAPGEDTPYNADCPLVGIEEEEDEEYEPLGYEVTLSGNPEDPESIQDDKNFGNEEVQPIEGGHISGMKWNDENGNGFMDGNEQGLAGWTITLIGPDDDTSTTTDSEGNYFFDVFFTGQYTICEELEDGWSQTYPSSGTDCVELDDGGFGPFGHSSTLMLQNTTSSGNDFGNVAGPADESISGYKWNDENGDGIWDEGEEGLSGWTIILYDLDGEATATTTTDANGRYSFGNLSDGDYRVCEILMTSWEQTYPNGDNEGDVECDGEDEGAWGHDTFIEEGEGQGLFNFGNKELFENTEALCTDGEDNDNDGLTDENDPDCDGFFPDEDNGNGGGGGGGGGGGNTNGSDDDDDQQGQSFSLACAVSPQVAGIGQTVTFAAATAGADEPVSYLWSGAVSGNGQVLSTIFGTAGTFSGTVVATDGDGDTETVTCSVSVVAGPPPAGPGVGLGVGGGIPGDGTAGDDEGTAGDEDTLTDEGDDSEDEDELTGEEQGGVGFLAGVAEFFSGQSLIWAIILIALILALLWWFFWRGDEDDKGTVQPR